MKYIYRQQHSYLEGVDIDGVPNQYLFKDYIHGIKVDDYINDSNSASKIREHLAFYHELTHFEQDSCFFACIAKGLFEDIISDKLFSIKSISQMESPAFDKNGLISSKFGDSQISRIISIYHYIFHMPIVYMSSMESTTYAKMNYTDMLESHAEIKSLFNFILDYSGTADNCMAINEMIKDDERFGLFMDLDKYDKASLRFLGNSNRINRCYQVIRYNFIRFFLNRKSKFLNITFNGIDLDLEFLFYLYANGLPLENEIIIGYVRMVELFMMVAIELSMAIPSPNIIISHCLENPESAIKYNPVNRFYRVLEFFHIHQREFISIDINNTTWEDLFDYISRGMNEQSYMSYFRMYHDNLTINGNHKSMISFGQLDNIIHKRSFPIAKITSGMYDTFLVHNKSFAIYQDGRFIVAFSPSKNKINEFVVDIPENELIERRILGRYNRWRNLECTNERILSEEYVTDLLINKYIRWRFLVIKDGISKHKQCPFFTGCTRKNEFCNNLNNIGSRCNIINVLENYKPTYMLL